MNFHEWLKAMGYFPLGIIIENHRSRGESEEFVQGRVYEIVEEYKGWCLTKGIEPKGGRYYDV